MVPFEGYFEQYVDSRFEDSSFETLWNRLFVDKDLITTKEAIHKLYPYFNIEEKKIITFNPKDTIEIIPKSLTVDDIHTKISFYIKSEILKIIDINGKEVTFSDKFNQIHTINNTKLILKRL